MTIGEKLVFQTLIEDDSGKFDTATTTMLLSTYVFGQLVYGYNVGTPSTAKPIGASTVSAVSTLTDRVTHVASVTASATHSHGPSLSKGRIAGFAVGGAIFVALMALGVCIWFAKRRKQKVEFVQSVHMSAVGTPMVGSSARGTFEENDLSGAHSQGHLPAYEEGALGSSHHYTSVKTQDER